MRRIGTVKILVVLNALALHLRMDVLIELATKGCIQHLYASADSKNRYLSVDGKARNQEFLHITLVVNAVELHNRFLAQQKRIDIATATQKKSVNTVEQFAQIIRLLIRRHNKRDAACKQHRLVVAFGKRAIRISIIARDGYHRPFLLSRLHPCGQTLIFFSPVSLHIYSN